MQVPTETDRRSESPRQAASEDCRNLIPPKIYDLRAGEGCSDRSFNAAATFWREFFPVIEEHAAPLIEGYGCHVQAKLGESRRSRGEYALDLLVLGMVIRTYAGNARRTRRFVLALALGMLWIRKRAAWVKSLADEARVALLCSHGWRVNEPRTGYNVDQNSIEEGADLLRSLPRTITWMRATGDLEQEARRVDNWRSYLATMELWQAVRWLELAVELFDEFKRVSDEALGAYTKGVETFLSTEYARRGRREDQVFCGRSPAEYRLNMVAAEVMNLALREAFEFTPEKVVLVPACMRGARASMCQAQVRGVDMTCAGCDPECAVNRISEQMRRLGASVYLVSHTSGFSRWLDRWQREPSVGVVAVACLLNILPGGFEIRARRIGAQCVPLDFPGCKKHWDREGISTAVNEDRLVEIVARPLAN